MFKRKGQRLLPLALSDFGHCALRPFQLLQHEHRIHVRGYRYVLR